jgi:hypothetical protein
MEVNGEYMAASSTVGGGRHARPPPLARAVCQLFVSGADIEGSRTGRSAAGWVWYAGARRERRLGHLGRSGRLAMAVETVAWSRRRIARVGEVPVR